MEIKLHGYQVTEAISQYLENEYTMNIEDIGYIETMCIDLDNDEVLKSPIHFQEKREWNEEKEKWETLEKYEIEGIYIKRKKENGTKSFYTKLTASDFREPEIHENMNGLSIWIVRDVR
tara:strand:+ start:7682 stop:8038 length:357 start_codon:yes stop_codon:yes gene_type:complete